MIYSNILIFNIEIDIIDCHLLYQILITLEKKLLNNKLLIIYISYITIHFIVFNFERFIFAILF